MVSDRDRLIIRELASQYAELSNSDRNRSARERWRSLNNLRSSRPVVTCNVFHMLPEIDPHLPASRVEHEELRQVELWFNRALWSATLGDDHYFDPWFKVRAKMSVQPGGVWGVSPEVVHDEASRGWRNMPVLQRMEDLDKLKPNPHRVLDPDPPLARMAEDIFGDILPVHRNRVSVYHVFDGIIGAAAEALFGLEELMMALYENPEMVHRFMAFARDAVISNFKQCEAAGDWSSADYWYYNTPPHCDALPDPQAGAYGARMKDLVGFSHSQDFEAVSPAMVEEFLVNYERPILELFGRVCYGCCDTLDRKLDALARIPNLTKITVGPLADPACYPELFGSRAVISWRPMPTLMISEKLNEQALRQQFRDGLDKLKGCHVELHLHDLMTVRGDLSRLFRWSQIALEEAERAGR
jgi:hypothetical protein